MFLRGSAVYMTTEDIHHITKDTMKALDLFVSCEEDAEFTYYDDDGWSKEYEEGKSAETKISVKAGDRKQIHFHKNGFYQESWENLNLNVVSKEKGAYWVSVDGEKIPRFLIRDAFDEAETGWYYDMSDRIVKVKCKKPQKDDFEIVVSCEKFDLIGMENEI